MTTLDPAIRRDIDELVARARPEQIAQLLADIRKADLLPSPTHNSTKTVQ